MQLPQFVTFARTWQRSLSECYAKVCEIDDRLFGIAREIASEVSNRTQAAIDEWQTDILSPSEVQEIREQATRLSEETKAQVSEGGTGLRTPQSAATDPFGAGVFRMRLTMWVHVWSLAELAHSLRSSELTVCLRGVVHDVQPIVDLTSEMDVVADALSVLRVESGFPFDRGISWELTESLLKLALTPQHQDWVTFVGSYRRWTDAVTELVNWLLFKMGDSPDDEARCVELDYGLRNIDAQPLTRRLILKLFRAKVLHVDELNSTDLCWSDPSETAISTQVSKANKALLKLDRPEAISRRAMELIWTDSPEVTPR